MIGLVVALGTGYVATQGNFGKTDNRSQASNSCADSCATVTCNPQTNEAYKDENKKRSCVSACQLKCVFNFSCVSSESLCKEYSGGSVADKTLCSSQCGSGVCCKMNKSVNTTVTKYVCEASKTACKEYKNGTDVAKGCAPACSGTKNICCQYTASTGGSDRQREREHTGTPWPTRTPTPNSFSCNRCSTINGCERAQFQSLTNDCAQPVPGSTVTRITDCSCPSITGGNNTRCTSVCLPTRTPTPTRTVSTTRWNCSNTNCGTVSGSSSVIACTKNTKGEWITVCSSQAGTSSVPCECILKK